MLHDKILTLPIDSHDPNYPIIQYADDTIMVIHADESQLLAIKEMLIRFHASTGLKVNFNKSSLIPLNVDEAMTAHLAEVFECSIGQMPFAYLGLPMGTTRPKIQDLMPLVDRVERRLPASSAMLNQGARLQLLNSVISSMPIYHLCSLAIPQGIFKQLERIQKQCLWRGNSDTPRQSLAAWELVCRPKKKGGLGIVNLQIQNKTLLLKHLHKFYNKENVPWVSLIWNTYYNGNVPHATMLCGSFWWKDILKLSDLYRPVASVMVNVGDSALFWSDGWRINGSYRPLRDRLPHLVYFVRDDKLSVYDFLSLEDEEILFHLPLTQQAADEYFCLKDWISNLQRDPQAADSWHWPGKYGYTAKGFYNLMHFHMPTDQSCAWIWRSKCTMKIKVCGWLLKFDRLNTKDLLVRRH